MKLAERILFFRLKHGLTQMSLAELCGVSSAVISQLENPEKRKCPKPKTLRKVLAGMNLDEDEISSIIANEELFRQNNFYREQESLTENSMMKFFRQLNPEGQMIALKQLMALAKVDELRI